MNPHLRDLNGDQPWPSAQRLDELIHLPKGSPLWAWQPQLSYHLLEERRYPKEAGNSLTGLLFEMENFENVAHLDSVILRIDKILSNTDDADLRQAILMWLKHVLVGKKPFAAQAANLSNLSEVKNMLSERLDKWIAQQEQELEEKIIKKGIQQGIEKGIGKGECLVLQRLMAKRFGILPEWALRRLESATQTELEHWTEQILDAVSLEALFQ